LLHLVGSSVLLYLYNVVFRTGTEVQQIAHGWCLKLAGSHLARSGAKT